MARMIPTRQAGDLFAGHWALLSELGATPKALVWDNASAVGKWRAGRPQLTEAANAFRGSLGIGMVQCPPGDPEAKGLVERAYACLESSLLPGRRFTSPGDFNQQLVDWLERANVHPAGPRPLHAGSLQRLLGSPPPASGGWSRWWPTWGT